MIRQLGMLVIATVLVGGVHRSGAQSPSSMQSAKAPLDRAKRLNEVVNKLYGEGKFREAIPLAEQALRLREKALGLAHPDVAECLVNLADLYRKQDAYGRAEPLYVRALEIREKALGLRHLDVATTLASLALLYNAQGAYGKSEPLLVRALDIREKLLGPEHPEVAESLSNLANLYSAQAAYAKAESLFVRALEIREKALGPTHRDVAASLNELGIFYIVQGAYGRAQPFLVRALDIFEKVLGPKHPDLATSVNNLGMLYQAQGAYEKAEPFFVRSLEIGEKALGPTHRDVADSLNSLAGLYLAQGAYEKAGPLFVRALKIWEKALGAMHPTVALCLGNLAHLYLQQGAYGKAEPLLLRVLTIQEKSLGAMHPEVAFSLAKLAGLYEAQGVYKKAEPLFVRALDITEKALGPMHPAVATSLNNLANVYSDQGAYGKAEQFHVRALNIRENALGMMHPEVATSLTNLANLYQVQGAYGKAEPLYVRALAIQEKALGTVHPDLATSINNLAFLYEAQHAYGKVEPLYVRALEIWEKTLGAMHPRVATGLDNLARIYRRQGMYRKAEPLVVRALDIRERALGPMHPEVASSLSNLAALYQAQGLYGKMELLLVRALNIEEKALGAMHPDVVNKLYSLATLYWIQGAYARALPLLSGAAEIREAQLRTELARLSEPRKRDLMALLQGESRGLVSLHADAMPTSAEALELALTTVLRRKGRILDSLAETQATLRTHLTPMLREQLDQLAQARSELSTRLYARVDPRTAADRTSAITTLRARIETLEASLSTTSVEFRAQSEPVTVAKIQAALPRDATLVEFVRYQRFDARQAKLSQEELYVAYLVSSHGPPQWVALGEAAPLDAGIDAVLAAMHSQVSAETTKTALQRLDALVFAPIRVRLGNASHVILAPDGKLNLVPFEALIDPQGHYELEQRLVSYVTTGRDLLRLAAKNAPRSSAVLVADPDYGPLPTPGVPGTVSFAPLAGALAEATELRTYFPTMPLTGRKATKPALAALTGPAMVHIATHGFYARDSATLPITGPLLPTQPASAPGSAQPQHAITSTTAQPPAPAKVAQADVQRGMVVEGGASTPVAPARSEDPADGLDRAGLAMAGANQGSEGIVTAREIAGFDWWGTKLVVLSACETGVGALASGDGVYGLRRALVLAGAESQVVSLWNVNDASTAVLMREYYGELARGTGRAEALRQAKLRLLRQPRYAHPYYWAAFIPAGDWRPLDKNTIRQSARGQ
jgi:CHAT domain-containing protein/Tfp pilus assembly protein PilF